MKIGYSLQLGDLKMKIKRHLYIKKRSKSENKSTVCAVQYSPICSDIKKIIDKHWYVLKSNVFSHPHSGRKFKIKGVITCTTKNFIYMIKCPCGLAYIGKTQRALKTRIAEHRSSIRTNDKKNPVAVHFNLKRKTQPFHTEVYWS